MGCRSRSLRWLGSATGYNAAVSGSAIPDPDGWFAIDNDLKKWSIRARRDEFRFVGTCRSEFLREAGTNENPRVAARRAE